MPIFDYKAVAASGAVVRDRMEARDAETVLRHLQRQGHLPVEVKRAALRRRWWRPEPARRMAPPQDLAVATRELAVLLTAGQTVEQVLRLLAGGAAPPRLRPAFATALDRLREGASLADALEAAGAFPPLYLAMVRAGEAGGALDAQLAKLADMLERAARLRDNLVSALIYPMILVTVAVSAVLLLLGMVVPQFAPLFAGANHALPLATRIVLAASAALLHHGTTALAGGSLLILALPLLLRRPAVVAWWDRRLLWLPVIGPVVVMAATGRLARALGVLLKGGVSLPAALGLVRGVAANRVLVAMVDDLRVGIKDGKSLAASLPADHPLPGLAVQLLAVGEQSGRLEEVLIHLADIYDAKVEQSLKRLLAVFEPACVLALSLVVGTVIVSILLAVVSINDLAF